MKAFCINLKEAEERRNHCAKQFAREGIDVTFIRGFNGRASKLHHAENWIDCQVGACISHYMVVEEIRHNKYGPTILFEDDITLPENFMHKLHDAMQHLPANWQVAALSWFIGHGCKATWKPVNHYWQQFTGGDVWGQAAYMINGSAGAEAVLNCIHPIYSHIDRMFWENCRDGKLNGYFIKTPLVQQDWNFQSQNI